MSAKHICQTFKKNVKMLHIINLGPPGTGKSYLLTVLEMITPDGVVEAVTHVSDQRNFADLLHIEENTSIVNTYDEARHDMLGTGRRGDHRGGGGNYVENATTSRANENKVWGCGAPLAPPLAQIPAGALLRARLSPLCAGNSDEATRELRVPAGVQGRRARAQARHRGGAGVVGAAGNPRPVFLSVFFSDSGLLGGMGGFPPNRCPNW